MGIEWKLSELLWSNCLFFYGRCIGFYFKRIESRWDCGDSWCDIIGRRWNGKGIEIRVFV